jgi:hypothetical protein
MKSEGGKRRAEEGSPLPRSVCVASFPKSEIRNLVAHGVVALLQAADAVTRVHPSTAFGTWMFEADRGFSKRSLTSYICKCYNEGIGQRDARDDEKSAAGGGKGWMIR